MDAQRRHVYHRRSPQVIVRVSWWQCCFLFPRSFELFSCFIFSFAGLVWFHSTIQFIVARFLLVLRRILFQVFNLFLKDDLNRTAATHRDDPPVLYGLGWSLFWALTCDTWCRRPGYVTWSRQSIFCFFTATWVLNFLYELGFTENVRVIAEQASSSETIHCNTYSCGLQVSFAEQASSLIVSYNSSWIRS